MDTVESKSPITPVVPAPKIPSNPAQVGDVNIAPTTTAAQDAVVVGQRKINLLWEVTQSIVALAVIGVTVYVDAKVAMSGKTISAAESAGLMQLNVMATMIMTFYFVRTNHQKTGGVLAGDNSR